MIYYSPFRRTVPLKQRLIAVKSAKCNARTHVVDLQGFSRRDSLAAAVGAVVFTCPSAYAVQGLTAGRVPGISPDPNNPGWNLYTRPIGKSGGHGVGWSEIPQYSFSVPEDGWAEVPVSIADLGGTEIDLRLRNKDEGDVSVVVAPVLRFRDVGYNADVDIAALGSPERMINGFAPELFGAPLNEDDVLDSRVFERDGITYYQWQLKPHRVVTATATGNRVFLLALSANSRQWRKGALHLETMASSFRVPPAKNYNVGF